MVRQLFCSVYWRRITSSHRTIFRKPRIIFFKRPAFHSEHFRFSEHEKRKDQNNLKPHYKIAPKGAGLPYQICECTSSTLEIMYLAHLRKTWKTLHSVSIEEWCKNGHYFLAELELELIYLTSDALLYNQQTSDAKEILEWLCRPFLFACMQKRNKESIRILPLAAVKLAKLEFIEGNIKQAWNILEQTKRLMKREQNNGAIWLILNCQNILSLLHVIRNSLFKKKF